jgi:hypothetical protein
MVVGKRIELINYEFHTLLSVIIQKLQHHIAHGLIHSYSHRSCIGVSYIIVVNNIKQLYRMESISLYKEMRCN